MFIEYLMELVGGCMKKISVKSALVLVMVVLVSIGLIWVVDRPIDPLASVVMVWTDGGRGSGVVIAADRVLTCWHVADGANVRVDGHTVTSVWRDPDSDLAILTVEPPFECRPLEIDKTPLKVGDEVSVVGFPADLPICRLWGRVVAKNCPVLTTPEADVLDVHAGPGCSGSPVIDKHGRIRALWFAFNTWVDLSYAIPMEDLDE